MRFYLPKLSTKIIKAGLPSSVALFGIILLSVIFLNASSTVKAAGGDNVLAMGHNNFGQLGQGTFDNLNYSTPVIINNLSNVTKVAAGGQGTSFAIKTDGTVWAWGFNFYGDLGNNNTTNQSSPVQVVGQGGNGFFTNVKSIATSSVQTLAVKNDGTVWAWGNNQAGELGDNRNGDPVGSSTPVQVNGLGGIGFLTNAIAVATGDNAPSSYALKADGTVWAWGANNVGQLGDGTINQQNTPVQVVGPGGIGHLAGITAIAGGTNYAIALKNDGTVWAWGQGNTGVLGTGNDTGSRTPVQVVGPGGTGFLSNVIAIATGADISIALRNDGTIWMWGSNNLGQLGQGFTSGESNFPIQVKDTTGTSFLTNVTSIFEAGDHTFAITSDKKVWGWGNNGGVLGSGTTNNISLPREITSLFGLSAIGTGDTHTLVAKPIAPTVNPITDATINQGETYTANGSFSDPDSTSWTATVNYGDQTGTQPLTLNGTSFTLSHQYMTAGTYTLTVQVTDESGGVGTATATITVVQVGPTLVAAINSGGDTQGSYLADTDFTGGTQYSSSNPVDTSAVTNPAPNAVYQTVRYGNFTYTIPNLTPGGTYTIRLHFNELYWGTSLAGNNGGVGSRVFNVSINGSQVLSNFDIYQTAGGANKAITEQFPATPDANGNVTIDFTTVADNAMVNGIEVYSGILPSPTPTPTPTPATFVALNAGGLAQSNFLADADYSGGQGYSSTAPVDTSNVTNPAPESVYQTVRFGNFTYNIPNLYPNTPYTVRLHFNELYWGTPLADNTGGIGSRVFNVAINGTDVLDNYDIFQDAGGANIAVVKQFTATSDATGKISIQFSSVVDNAMVNGIEVFQ